MSPVGGINALVYLKGVFSVKPNKPNPAASPADLDTVHPSKLSEAIGHEHAADKLFRQAEALELSGASPQKARELYRKAAQHCLMASESEPSELFAKDAYRLAVVSLIRAEGKVTKEIKGLMDNKPDSRWQDIVWLNMNRNMVFGALKGTDNPVVLKALRRGFVIEVANTLMEAVDQPDLQYVAAKYYIHIAHQYQQKGDSWVVGVNLARAAKALKASGKVDASKRLYSGAAKKFMRVDTVNSYIEAAKCLELAGRQQEAKKVWAKAGEKALRCKKLTTALEAFTRAGDFKKVAEVNYQRAKIYAKNADEMMGAQEFVLAASYYKNARVMMQRAKQPEQAAILQKKEQLANLQAKNLHSKKRRFNGLQRIRSPKEQAIDAKKAYNSSKRRLTSLKIAKFQQLLAVYLSSEVVDKMVFHDKLDTFQALDLRDIFFAASQVAQEAGNEVFAQYLVVLSQQCDVIASIAHDLNDANAVEERKISFPPTKQEMIDYARTFEDKDSKEAEQAYTEFAQAFFVHAGEVLGGIDIEYNGGNPSSWAEITSQREMSFDGRRINDCEGFAYVAVQFFMAAGYKPVGQGVFAVADQYSGHAIAVLEKGGKKIYISNSAVFHNVAALKADLYQMNLSSADILGTLKQIQAL